MTFAIARPTPRTHEPAKFLRYPAGKKNYPAMQRRLLPEINSFTSRSKRLYAEG